MNTRHSVLAAALVATLIAVWMSGQGSEEDSSDTIEVIQAKPRPAASALPAPTGKPAAAVSNATATADATEAGLRFPASGADLFPAQSWRPPPPPAPVFVAPPPPPPQAPPLPYKYIGRWDAGDGESFFLAQGEQVLSVKVGQKLASWQLDSVDAGGLNFTYLPLQQKRQLRFGP
jgi:hypothetical protein